MRKFVGWNYTKDFHTRTLMWMIIIMVSVASFTVLYALKKMSNTVQNRWSRLVIPTYHVCSRSEQQHNLSFTVTCLKLKRRLPDSTLVSKALEETSKPIVMLQSRWIQKSFQKVQVYRVAVNNFQKLISLFILLVYSISKTRFSRYLQCKV